MAPSAKLKSLVAQMPDPDKRGTYANIDKDKVERAVAEIHKGGRQNVLGLIDMLVEPGKGNDIKPHYALHVLAVHVCKLPDEKPRAEFARAVAARLADRPKGVQKYLIRQLQVAGDGEVVEALGRALLDAELCEPAAQALVAIGARRSRAAGDQFRAALPKVKGAGRLTVLQGLGAVRDARAVGALKQALGDPDAEVRLAGAWGLACIGDAGSAALLLQAADRHLGWERIKETKACLILAENLRAAGKTDAARKIYTHLRDTRTDASEQHIRAAARKALAAV